MRSCVRFAAVAFALAPLAYLPSGLAPAPVPAGDALWGKAVAWASAAEAQGVTPGRMEVRVVVRKKDGTVDSISQASYRIVGSGDAAEPELLSFVKDGKDITREAREAEAEERAKVRASKAQGGGRRGGPKDPDEDSSSLDPAYHPFSPRFSARVTYRRVGDTLLEGKPAVLYTFREDASAERAGVEGKTWLHPQTGLPLQVDSRPLDLPKHVERMAQKVVFAEGPEGLWVAERSEVGGSGGFLWIRRSVESTFRFSGHRKASAQAGP